MASTTQTSISVGEMFVRLSGDINCNLLRKSNLRLERVFSFSPHIDYGLLVTGQLLLSKRQNISPYDSFSSSVVLSNFFSFDLIQK